MRRISEIYAIEARIRGRAAGDRVAVRQAETKPLMEALWSWLMERLEEISAKSSLASDPLHPWSLEGADAVLVRWPGGSGR
jgi:hypothetical protein